jgi:hypothetical protein
LPRGSHSARAGTRCLNRLLAAGCCDVSFRATAINARSCCPSSATPVHLSRQSSCRRSPSLALSVARSSFFSPLAVLGIHPFMSILSCPLSFSSYFPACLFRTFTPVVAHCVEVSRTRSGRGQVGDAAIDLPDASVIIQVTGGSTCPCMPFCMLRALCLPCGRSSPPLPFFFTNRPPHSEKRCRGMCACHHDAHKHASLPPSLSVARARSHTHAHMHRYHRISGRDRRRRSD